MDESKSKKTYTGEMDRLVEVLTPTSVRDKYGAEQTSFLAVESVWAKVENHSGQESVAGNEQITAFRRTIFTMRYNSGISEKYRIRYEEEQYDILAIAHYGARNREFTKLTTELRK